MLKAYPADLHIHTCLSPCADEEMNPANILNMAKLMGTKIIAICDHNSAKNVKPVQEAAEDYDITVIPGMEVESAEEAHLLVFFEDLNTMMEWQDYVYKHLPAIKNNPKFFGPQQIVDRDSNITGEEDKMLISAISASAEEISQRVLKMGGMLVPAHIDRKTYSLMGQLGFIPADLEISAIEISRNVSEKEARRKFNIPDKYSIITSSDAHRLKEMVFQKTFLYIKTPNFVEIKKAFKGVEGRRVIIKE
ncbi:MAG: 3,5-nucleoside bisphosphate phosphatase [Tepidanaerobacteraceae bacterium]|nr:3,5-nucleoside bisphosphate phosphatase [Tepidanaerobacteraceae bacterium]